MRYTRGCLSRPTFAVCILGMALSFGSSGRADMGLPVASGNAGPFRVNIIALPVPLGVGNSTWSILVRDEASGRVRTDVGVDLDLSPEPAPETEQHRLTAIQAKPGTHPGFQSAAMRLRKSGPWQGRVDVRSPEGQQGHFNFAVEVGPRLSAWRDHVGMLTLPFLLVALFLWHQRRILAFERKHDRRRQQALRH